MNDSINATHRVVNCAFTCSQDFRFIATVTTLSGIASDVTVACI
jgi:hypothetical protein